MPQQIFDAMVPFVLICITTLGLCGYCISFKIPQENRRIIQITSIVCLIVPILFMIINGDISLVNQCLVAFPQANQTLFEQCSFLFISTAAFLGFLAAIFVVKHLQPFSLRMLARITFFLYSLLMLFTVIIQAHILLFLYTHIADRAFVGVMSDEVLDTACISHLLYVKVSHQGLLESYCPDSIFTPVQVYTTIPSKIYLHMKLDTVRHYATLNPAWSVAGWQAAQERPIR